MPRCWRDYKGIDVNTITLDSSFADLELDSLDVADLVMQIEDELDVSIELDQTVTTMKDLIARLEEAKKRMIHTQICDLLGIRYPIFQGGMAWVSEHKLAAAVSNAGGLGLISAMNAGGDYIRQEIRACRELTDKPFGVNVMLMSPHAAEVAQVLCEERVPVVTTGAGCPASI